MPVRQREVDYVDEERDRQLLRDLPSATRGAIGADIDRIQRGEQPLQ